MSDVWAIALVGGYITVMLAVWGLVATCLGKIAGWLARINDTLNQFVPKDDCDRLMGNQCGEIACLREQVSELRNAMTKMRTKMGFWHKGDN